jgi:hypothetical protein
MRVSQSCSQEVGLCEKAPGETGMELGMRTLYIEGVASHGGPESCVGDP